MSAPSRPSVTVPVILILLLSLSLISCSSDEESAASKAGFTEILGASGDGFLARDPVKDKKLLYLSGTHYEMGYQMGYLLPEGTASMLIDYMNNFLFDMLGLSITAEDLGSLWQEIRKWLEEEVDKTKHTVPEIYLEEMQGIVDGYGQAKAEGKPGTERSITLSDVLLLNQGMDLLSASTYNLLGSIMACNQYAVAGSLTMDGTLFHGRDFEFYNAGEYYRDAIIAVYVPHSKGHDPGGTPFVTVTAPGFVGLATGYNSKGVSIAIDVVQAFAGRFLNPGLGALLEVRRVTERAGSLDEAVGMLRDADRGCPWIYLVSDHNTGKAAVLETIQSSPLEPWMERTLGRNQGTAGGILGEPLQLSYPKKGLALRAMDYVLAEKYRGKGLKWPEWLPLRNNAQYPDNPYFQNYSFQDQIEELPEMVVCTNHFILPHMRPFQWSPLFGLVWMSYFPEEEWRYTTLTHTLMERTAGGGTFGWEEAWATIDFLNPKYPDGQFFHPGPQDQLIGGHIALMGMKDLRFRALYGKYSDAWVEVRLSDFIP